MTLILAGSDRTRLRILINQINCHIKDIQYISNNKKLIKRLEEIKSDVNKILDSGISQINPQETYYE